MLTLMYITNNPEVALIAERNGVDRIWIDLEYKGKEDRQKGLNTVKSKHTVQDIKNIASLLTSSEMLVRVNPWGEGSEEEIEAVVAAGADLIMLPMWKTAEEVKAFLNAVGNRCKTILLLETKSAADCIDDVLEISGIDEIHIGLNDLHLDFGLDFMFELLADGTVERICKKIATKGLPYGFGGIARLGEGALPADRIVMEHYRLGSTRAILSRSFCNTDLIRDLGEIERAFKDNLKLLREYETKLSMTSEADFMDNKLEVIRCVDAVVSAKRKG